MSETIPTMINDSRMTASLKATRRPEIVQDLKKKNEERGPCSSPLMPCSQSRTAAPRCRTREAPGQHPVGRVPRRAQADR